jgi:thioredoxin reductase
MDRLALPVAVIGAGPVGLAAAAHLHERGEPFVVLEAGDAIAASVRAWGQVRLFSPWRYVIDAAARRLLETTGWTAPDRDAYPTGADLVTAYLEPLAATAALAPHVRLGARVLAVARHGADRLRSQGRDQLPFELVVATQDGREDRVLARAVVDASGTWTTPNPLGTSGIPATGEADACDVIAYGIPDVRSAERDRYAAHTTLVVGAGHSAFNVLGDLAALADEAPRTRVVWAVRRGSVADVVGGGDRDQLPARGALGRRVADLVASGAVRLVTGFRATSVARADGRVLVGGLDLEGQPTSLEPVDRVVVATGFRPDLSLHAELRLALDPIVETTPALAPLIDPNLHSCGTVPPHGAAELAHPEPDFYVVGMKAYGRAPTFLLLTGYEQVRSVVAALVGDHQAAAAVHLELPETGVCGVPSVPAETAHPLALAGGGACCG